MSTDHEKSKDCDYIEFPRHPLSSRTSQCNTPLMKWVCVGGKARLVPRKTFHYHSAIAGIEKILQSEHFLQYCDLWKKRPSSIPNGVYSDIYDGKVWQDFQHIDGTSFLADSGNLWLMLNIDWFNPYEETQYSVGTIYLVVQNLPRSERFKINNIILVGLMPGPREPKSTSKCLK